MTETIRYGLLGLEDLKVGLGTFEATLADGSVVTLHEVPLGRTIFDYGDTVTAGDTTPSANGVSYLGFSNTAATTVTAIDDGVGGQLLILRLDAQTTLSHEAGGAGQLSLSADANVVGTANQIVALFYDTRSSPATWRQLENVTKLPPLPIRILDSAGNLIHAFGTIT